MSDATKKIIGLIVALAAFGLVVFYLLGEGATVVGPENLTGETTFPEVARAQEMLREVKRVRIDTDVLERDGYRALVDRHVEIPPQVPGNPMPFGRDEEYSFDEGITVFQQVGGDIPETVFNIGAAVGDGGGEN